MKVRPLGDRVLVLPADSESAEQDGILIPEMAQEKSREGYVVSVGKGRIDLYGKRVPLGVKKGDSIIMSKYGGTDVKIDDEVLRIVSEEDILAIVE